MEAFCADAKICGVPVIEITKSFRFEAAHSLPYLPVGHKCRNLHGHSYEVVVGVEGELDGRGFVIDYAEISEVVKPLIAQLDHKNLNEVLDTEKTTAENLALWFASNLKSIPLSRVEVRETTTSNVILRIRS
jgi:6-pyruvoyltetrahydropterin/6-carboxytetrahydropterin synthase